MKKNSFLLLLLTTLLSSSVLAGTMGPAPAEWAWVGTFSIGPVWEEGGKRQTFFLAPEIEKTYAPYKSTRALVNGELFVGVQKSVVQQLQAQLGLAVATTSDARLSGEIWDDADPLFNNHNYRYKVQHTYIAVKGKLLADRGYWLTPWISGSIGVGFNDAYSYSNRPRIPAALPNPNFRDHTTTTFSYTVGAGLQKALDPNWQVGVGYEFADWGKSKLYSAPAQIFGHGLTLNHFYTNGILFNLTYIA